MTNAIRISKGENNTGIFYLIICLTLVHSIWKSLVSFCLIILFKLFTYMFCLSISNSQQNVFPSFVFLSSSFTSYFYIPSFLRVLQLIPFILSVHLTTRRVCAQLCPTLYNPMDCSPPGSFCPWDFPGKNTGVGCHSHLQGIFLTQGVNTRLLSLLLWQSGSLPLTTL